MENKMGFTSPDILKFVRFFVRKSANTVLNIIIGVQCRPLKGLWSGNPNHNIPIALCLHSAVKVVISDGRSTIISFKPYWYYVFYSLTQILSTVLYFLVCIKWIMAENKYHNM